MLGDCKNAEELHHNLGAWRSLKKSQVLIHTINPGFKDKTELMRKNAELVFSEWDVLSTSLVDIDKIEKFNKNQIKNINATERFSRDTNLFFEIGLILDVPAQNILGTHSQDVWFPNHAGNKYNNTYSLADAIISGKGKQGGRSRWPCTTGHSYNNIKTPKYILDHTSWTAHNEILVICRPFINIYPGFPPTDKIKVKGIIVAPRNVSGHSMHQERKDRSYNEAIATLKRLNPRVPVKRL